MIDMKQSEVVKNDEAQRSSHAFPSSSIVKGQLGDIYRASKVKVVIDNDTRLRSNSRGRRASHEEVENKPLSASGVSSRAISILPDLDEGKQVTKRHTLPSILTAGSKTMSPRPKSGSKPPKPLERIGKPLSKIKHGRQYSVTSNKKIKTNVTVG